MRIPLIAALLGCLVIGCGGDGDPLMDDGRISGSLDSLREECVDFTPLELEARFGPWASSYESQEGATYLVYGGRQRVSQYTFHVHDGRVTDVSFDSR